MLWQTIAFSIGLMVGGTILYFIGKWLERRRINVGSVHEANMKVLLLDEFKNLQTETGVELLTDRCGKRGDR